MNAFQKILLPVLISLFTSQSQAGAQEELRSNQKYQLEIFDRVEVKVFEEPELGMAEGIDNNGKIRLPLIGEIKIAGLTVREAEQLLEQKFIADKILRRPLVTITVLNYTTKSVSVLGAIARPGELEFPDQIEKLEIIKLISMVGGFTTYAKSKQVRITRSKDNGSQQVFYVDVEKLLKGDSNDQIEKSVFIYPGDLIYVDERLF